LEQTGIQNTKHMYLDVDYDETNEEKLVINEPEIAC